MFTKLATAPAYCTSTCTCIAVCVLWVWGLPLLTLPCALPCTSRRTLINRTGDRFLFIATTLVEGGVPLDEAGAALSIPQPALAAAMEHAAQGLEAIHNLQVAHGDVRGANCLVVPGSRAVWVDFSHAELGAGAMTMDEERTDLQRIVRDVLVQGFTGYGEREIEAMATCATPPSAPTTVGEVDHSMGSSCSRDVRASVSRPMHARGSAQAAYHCALPYTG